MPQRHPPGICSAAFPARVPHVNRRPSSFLAGTGDSMPTHLRRVTRALLSVSDKTGLIDFALQPSWQIQLLLFALLMRRRQFPRRMLLLRRRLSLSPLPPPRPFWAFAMISTQPSSRLSISNTKTGNCVLPTIARQTPKCKNYYRLMKPRTVE